MGRREQLDRTLSRFAAAILLRLWQTDRRTRSRTRARSCKAAERIDSCVRSHKSLRRLCSLCATLFGARLPRPVRSLCALLMDPSGGISIHGTSPPVINLAKHTRTHNGYLYIYILYTYGECTPNQISTAGLAYLCQVGHVDAVLLIVDSIRF